MTYEEHLAWEQKQIAKWLKKNKPIVIHPRKLEEGQTSSYRVSV